MKKGAPFRFYRGIVGGGLVVVLSYAAFFYYLFHYTDAEAYRKLIAKANPTNVKSQTAPYTARQKRKDLRKEILYSQEGKRLRMLLLSDESEMQLDHNTEGHELVEVMRPLQVYMQEDLFEESPGGSPMQHLRYMVADHAIYSFKSGILKADDVKIYRYKLPGHDFNIAVEGLQPIMKGSAAHVEFSVDGKELNFQAQNLKAVFTGEGGLF